MTPGKRLFTFEEWESYNPLYQALLSQVYLRRTGWDGRLRLLTHEELANLTDGDFADASAAYLKIEPNRPLTPEGETTMDDQHRKITGYRDLTEAEINLMNEIKALEAKWNGLIDRLRATEGIDQRQASIAATDGESAFMRAVRAVAQPTRIVE